MEEARGFRGWPRWLRWFVYIGVAWAVINLLAFAAVRLIPPGS